MIQILIATMALLVPLTSQAATLKAHGGPVAAQVQTLPEDASQWHVSVMGDPSDPEFRKVTAWFQTNPDLQKLAKRTHYTAMPASSRLYKARYAATVPDLPCIRVQKPDGTVMCQLSGDNIPATSPATFAAIRNFCYRCQPKPSEPEPNIHYHIHKQEKPTPEPEEEVPFDDSIIEKEEPAVEEQGPSPYWLVPVGLVAFAVAIGIQWKRSNAG